MINPFFTVQYKPKQKFQGEQIFVYVSSENRHYFPCERYLVYCGSTRNGVAIAYNADYLFLVRVCYEDSINPIESEKYGIILHKFNVKESKQWSNDDHKYELQRTITGYYVFEDTYEHTRVRPGRDDQYYDATDYTVFDECGNLLKQYDRDAVMIGSYLCDISEMYAEFNNNFYDVNSLKVIYTLPDKYSRNGVYEHNLLNLDVVGDYKDYYVLVKNTKIVKQYSDDKLDSILRSLSLKEDDYLSKTKYSIANYDEMSEEEIKLCDDALKFATAIRYGNVISERYSYQNKYVISSNEYELLDFNSNDEINPNIVNVIKKIRAYCLVKSKRESFDKDRLKKLICLTADVYCYIFKDFFVLVKQIDIPGNRHIAYKFYDYSGKLCLPGVYTDVRYGYDNTNDRSIGSRKNIDSNVFVANNIISGNTCVVFLSKHQSKEILIGDNMNLVLCNDNNYCIYDEANDVYLDFDLNPLEIRYVPCKVKCLIDKYLYDLDHIYYSHDYYKNAGCGLYEIGDGCICACCLPDVTIINGQLTLPLPRTFKNCIEEVNCRNKNRPNFVEEVKEIASFQTAEGTEVLYKFMCKPHAYIDNKFNIIYDFDVNNIRF